MLQQSFVEIDLNAIRSNIAAIKERCGADKKLLLAVKSDGYGHGAVQVSSMVEEYMIADMLGVASPVEGIELRKAGIKLPILVLSLILPRDDLVKTLIDYNLSQTVANINLADSISKIARINNKTANIHLKVDTGMGRIGCTPDDVLPIVKEIKKLDNINLEGIYSHFPVSDVPDSQFTISQIKKFEKILSDIDTSGIYIPYRHMANSAAIINYTSCFNMIRPGVMAYGYFPSELCKKDIPLIPSMSFYSSIVFTKRVRGGTSLSYGLTYTTKKDSNIATIPIGYGDGYSRFLSNKGFVIINNRKYPVAGRVCMDQILVDLGDDSYAPGEKVIIFGEKDITVETIANWIGTIPYEVTCSISKRVPRVYI